MATKIGYHSLVINLTEGTGVEATITVYKAGTVDKASIYSDPEGTPKDNPFLTDAIGRFSFYAKKGEYDIEASGVGVTTYKLEDVSIIGTSKEIILTDPSSGEYRLKKLRLDSDKGIVVTHPENPEV